MPQARLRSRTRSVFAAATASLALAAVASACTPSAAPSPSASDLYRLRMCESGGNYAIATGNGYYGAYQFDAGTWASLGFGGLPSQAAPWVQDEAVAKLWRMRGWAPWPGCSSSLGL
ncbi:MAG TPA: transglycosylase family protein [Frankiaceae bacterium]|nr:transglycosylase family protein [Frankiaceae bacterium]